MPDELDHYFVQLHARGNVTAHRAFEPALRKGRFFLVQNIIYFFRPLEWEPPACPVSPVDNESVI